MDKTSLGDRMKEYENAYRFYLPKRPPLILRTDGRAFHTYTHNFDRPFDYTLHRAMMETALAVCREISGAKLAYTQSDEISVLITNNDTLTTQPWFGNNLQKIVSIAAAVASTSFQNAMHRITEEELEYKDFYEYIHTRTRYCGNVVFDARAFVLPEHEVTNYFIWRQQDAIRNSIQMVAYTVFSPKECFHKNTSQLKEMLLDKGIDWDNYETWKKFGTCIVKKEKERPIAFLTKDNVTTKQTITVNTWTEDEDIPNFVENRAYIENLLPNN